MAIATPQANQVITADDVRAILLQNPLTMTVLNAVAGLGLHDWAVGAGFVRNQVWDYLHGYPLTASFADIDVLFFDAANTGKEHEEAAERMLAAQLPQFSWEVRNQARMHLKKQDAPYKNTVDGIARWVETATAVAVKLGADGRLDFVAPWGLDDLCAMVLRPTAADLVADYHRRVETKGWRTRWPKVVFNPRPKGND